jgi:hypothetical protein
MHLMSISTYPMTSIGDVVKVFLEVMKAGYPDYIEMEGPYNRWGGNGIVTTVIYKIQDDKIMEAVKEIVANDAKYADIQGYKLESSIVLDTQDSLAIVGEKLP